MFDIFDFLASNLEMVSLRCQFLSVHTHIWIPGQPRCIPRYITFYSTKKDIFQVDLRAGLFEKSNSYVQRLLQENQFWNVTRVQSLFVWLCIFVLIKQSDNSIYRLHMSYYYKLFLFRKVKVLQVVKSFKLFLAAKLKVQASTILVQVTCLTIRLTQPPLLCLPSAIDNTSRLLPSTASAKLCIYHSRPLLRLH